MTPREPLWLAELRELDQRRLGSFVPFPFDQPPDADARGFVSCHNNDYLRLSAHPEVVNATMAATLATGSGAMASLVYGGAHGHHAEFCALLAQTARAPSASSVVLTASGWTANVGLLEVIAQSERAVYIDSHAHASLWDGARLSPARTIPLPHARVDLARYGPGVVVIDAYYSTHGEVARLADYVALCEQTESVLVVDEAHSFGMCGEGGGLSASAGLAERVHFRTFSFAKALGGSGGAVIGNHAESGRWLTYRMRPVIFSSAPPPATSAGNQRALELLLREPERARRALGSAELLRTRLRAAGVDTGPSACQIVSLYFDGEQTAPRLYAALRERKILFSTFISPAVPAGASLARFSLYFGLSDERVEELARAIIEELDRLGLSSRFPRP